MRMPVFTLGLLTSLTVATVASAADAKATAIKGLDFYASIMQKGKWGKGGGWAGTYSADLSKRTGEAKQPVPSDVVLIQPPGTANVGTIFLRASKVLGEQKYLEVARMTADTLIAGQTTHGGWNCEMWISPTGPKGIHVYPGATDWSKKQPNPNDDGTLDDSAHFAPAEYMYAMWMVTKDDKYKQAWLKSMEFLIKCQLPGGGYRQAYPRGGYHAYATFNDGAMLNAARTLLKAYQRTGDTKYLNSVKKCGDFLIRCQSKGGGYAAQHTDSGAPADARKFEPPGLGPDATRDAIAILALIYDTTGEAKYLAPLGKAAAWLERVKIGSNKWARYYHPNNDKPWYRNITGKDVSSAKEAKPKYTWEGAWGAAGITKAKAYSGKGAGKPVTVPSGGDPNYGFSLRGGGFAGLKGSGKTPETVPQIIAAQDARGRWFGGKGKKTGGNMSTGQWVCYLDRLLDSVAGTSGPAPADSGDD